MKFDEKRQLEMQIGFLIGTTIGVLGSWTFILFFVQWQWYFKLVSSIGEAGILGTLFLSIKQSLAARKNYLEVTKQMESINKEANTTINDLNSKDNTICKEVKNVEK